MTQGDDRYQPSAGHRPPPSRTDADDTEGYPRPVPTHAETEQPDDADYFAAPPPEVGQVTSASTTLGAGEQPAGVGVRLATGLIFAGVGAAIGLGVVLFFKMTGTFWPVAWPAGLGLGGFGLAWAYTGFRHVCTYVGTDGVAKYTCAGSRDEVTSEVFAFRDAAELRTSQTRHYTNSVYQGTDYAYSWTDVAGRVRYVISGRHTSEQGTPPPGDLYHYATAAEMAWSLYMLAGVERQVMTNGEVRFGLGGSDWVAVGPDQLRLRLSGSVTECDIRDIGTVSIANGVFTVKRLDAQEGWFSSSGVFRFDYSRVGNAQLFLFVLRKVAGIEVL
jgi:hypothetical protein